METALSFEPAVVLKDLRSARRKQRIADFDAFEALYRAYLTGITLSLGVLLLSGTTGDTKIVGPDLNAIRLNGGAWVGLAIALAFAVGLRSGGRGGLWWWRRPTSAMCSWPRWTAPWPCVGPPSVN